MSRSSSERPGQDPNDEEEAGKKIPHDGDASAPNTERSARRRSSSNSSSSSGGGGGSSSGSSSSSSSGSDSGRVANAGDSTFDAAAAAPAGTSHAENGDGKPRREAPRDEQATARTAASAGTAVGDDPRNGRPYRIRRRDESDASEDGGEISETERAVRNGGGGGNVRASRTGDRGDSRSSSRRPGASADEHRRDYSRIGRKKASSRSEDNRRRDGSRCRLDGGNGGGDVNHKSRRSRSAEHEDDGGREEGRGRRSGGGERGQGQRRSSPGRGRWKGPTRDDSRERSRGYRRNVGGQRIYGGSGDTRDVAGGERRERRERDRGRADGSRDRYRAKDRPDAGFRSWRGGSGGDERDRGRDGRGGEFRGRYERGSDGGKRGYGVSETYRGRGGGGRDAAGAGRSADLTGASGRHGGSGDGGGGGGPPGEQQRSPSPVVGFIDGQWVSGGIVGEDADNGKTDAGRAPAAAVGQAGKRVGQLSGTGGGSVGREYLTLKSVRVPAATAAPTPGTGSGEVPRRPRWDKAKPSAGLGVAVANVSGNVMPGKKKLVWGAAGAATGGGVKRPLWAGAAETGAGGAASSGFGGAPSPGSQAQKEGDQAAKDVEQRWQAAAAALGPTERQVKFLKLLGAKKGAAATAAAAAAQGTSATGTGRRNPFSSPISPDAGGGTGEVDSAEARAANAKVMQDLEIHYQKAHRAHFGFQRGLGK